MFEKLKKMFLEKDNKRKTENLVVFLIILIITLIVINKILEDDKLPIDSSNNAELVYGSYETNNEFSNLDEVDLETKLKDILAKIKGVGEVDVLLTYSETSSISPLYNENISLSTSTSETGEVTETKTENREIFTNNQNEAVIQKKEYPKLEGAIIIAEGANSQEVKTNIIYAVEAATGLLTHKIQVFEMKGVDK